jgi:hypothetical protein
MATSKKPEWTGTWVERTSVPGASDGTSTVTLTLKPGPKSVSVLYEEVGSLRLAYRARGTVKAGRLEVRFVSPVTNNLNPKTYSKGKLLFALARVASKPPALQSSWKMEDGAWVPGGRFVLENPS